MKPNELTLDSTVLLEHGFGQLDTEENFPSILHSAFETMAALSNVGANIMNVETEIMTVGEAPPHYFPKDIPPEAKYYSVRWQTTQPVRTALLWAKDEADGDFLSELGDCWPIHVCPFPENELEDLYGTLMNEMGELVEEWRERNEDAPDEGDW